MKIDFKIFIKYAVVWLSWTIIDLTSLYFFVDILKIYLYLWITLSFLLAVLNNFLFNKLWTFRDKSIKYKRQFIKFLIVSIIWFILTLFFMYIFVDLIKIYYLYAKIMTSMIVILWNFLWNKYWTFKNNSNILIQEKKDFDTYISIIIPAYNEEKRILITINKIVWYLTKEKYIYEIIIVNDWSIDDTEKIIYDLISKNNNIKLISYKTNTWKWYAVKCWMMNWIGKYLLFLDADNSTPIEELKKLIQYVDDYDIVIWSRYLDKSNIIIKQSKLRFFISRIWNFLISAFLIDWILDTQCWFKLFKHNVAKHICKFQKVKWFWFDMELLFIANLLWYKIKETPVNWINDTKSKFSPIKHSIKTFFELIYIKLNYFFDWYK